MNDNPYQSPEYVDEPEPSRVVLWFREGWRDFRNSFLFEFWPIPVFCAIIVGILWLALGLFTGTWAPLGMVLGLWVYLTVGTIALFLVAIFFMFMGF